MRVYCNSFLSIKFKMLRQKIVNKKIKSKHFLLTFPAKIFYKKNQMKLIATTTIFTICGNKLVRKKNFNRVELSKDVLFLSMY